MEKIDVEKMNLSKNHQKIENVIEEVLPVKKTERIRYLRNFKERQTTAFLINGVWYRVVYANWTSNFIYKLELREVPKSAYNPVFCNNL